MKCNEARNLVVPYLDSELDAKASQEIQLHLQSCAECAEVFAREERFNERLFRVLRAGQATPALWEKGELSLDSRCSSRHAAPEARWTWRGRSRTTTANSLRGRCDRSSSEACRMRWSRNSRADWTLTRSRRGPLWMASGTKARGFAICPACRSPGRLAGFRRCRFRWSFSSGKSWNISPTPRRGWSPVSRWFAQKRGAINSQFGLWTAMSFVSSAI